MSATINIPNCLCYSNKNPIKILQKNILPDNRIYAAVWIFLSRKAFVSFLRITRNFFRLPPSNRTQKTSARIPRSRHMAAPIRAANDQKLCVTPSAAICTVPNSAVILLQATFASWNKPFSYPENLQTVSSYIRFILGQNHPAPSGTGKIRRFFNRR